MAAKGPAALFVIGGLVFAGTLYLMALGAPRWFGAITPIGGLALIAGWLWLAWSVARSGMGFGARMLMAWRAMAGWC